MLKSIRLDLQLIKSKRLLVAMIAKNVNPYIKRVLANAHRYGSYFSDYSITVIDGHSTDGTFETCQEDSKVTVFRQPSTFLSRPFSLCEARNMYLSLLESQFGENVYLLVLDSDIINCDPMDESGFLSCFSYPLEEWDMMGANQTHSYYDVWTLRSSECPEDFQEVMRREGNYDYTSFHYLKKNQVPKPRQQAPYAVESAFGGAALYHTEKIKGLRYKCFVEELGNPFWGAWKEVCEHVPFCQALRAKGGRLFINPAFINASGLNY